MLVVPMLAAGLGISVTMPAATSAVVEGAPSGQAGLASGVLNASRQMGGAFGIALLGSLFVTAGQEESGARLALLAAALGYLFAVGFALAMPAHRPPYDHSR